MATRSRRVSRLEAALWSRFGVTSSPEPQIFKVSIKGDGVPVTRIDPKEANVAETKATAPRNMNRLDQSEYWRLYKWLEKRLGENGEGFAPGTTNAQAAAVAENSLGFKITEWHIKGALETTGLALPPAVKPLDLAAVHEKVMKVAQATADALDVLLLWNGAGLSVSDMAALRDELRELSK